MGHSERSARTCIATFPWKKTSVYSKPVSITLKDSSVITAQKKLQAAAFNKATACSSCHLLIYKTSAWKVSHSRQAPISK
jgi:hypothetical protein